MKLLRTEARDESVSRETGDSDRRKSQLVPLCDRTGKAPSVARCNAYYAQ